MRTFSANFITQKDATFAKPFLIALFKSSLGSVRISDRTRTLESNLYSGIVESWGSLGASLSGFGEAFASSGTTVEISNARELVDGTRRFSSYLPRFLNSTMMDMFWCFEHPDTNAIYYEVAIRGPIIRASWTYETATIEVKSLAEQIMNRDVLKTIDFEGCPDSNIGRPLPIGINRINKLPMWIYSDDRSKFAIAEDVRPVVSYNYGSRYYRGESVHEADTSAG